jgi:vacuolar-type H+-ATPase subunit H
MKQNEDETKMGALDALDKIKKAEEEARELINEAKEHTSLQIIQDAQEEAQKIKKEIINGARNKVQSIREVLIKKG